MHSEEDESAERPCTEELRRKAEGAARTVHTVRVGDERERAARLSFSPLREAENSFFKRRLRRIKTDTETGSKAGSIRPPRRDRRA